MKTIILSLLSLTLFTFSAQANNAVEKVEQLRKNKELLEARQEYLEEKIATSSTQAEIIDEELNFIETYIADELTIESFIGENPLVSEASYVAALGTAAKLLDGRIVAAVGAANANLIARLIQKHPRLTRSANGLTAVVALGMATYYTMQKVALVSQLEEMSKEQKNAVYESRLNEMQLYRKMVIDATEQLVDVHYQLSLIDAELMKKTYEPAK